MHLILIYFLTDIFINLLYITLVTLLWLKLFRLTTTSNRVVNMQTPYVEVSQLAPATSFYATLLQPLDLRYLASESSVAGPGYSIFGSNLGPVLCLRQISKSCSLRLSSVQISALSPAVIGKFYENGTLANPTLAYRAEKGAEKATIFDLDGNMLQAICSSSETITGQFTLFLDRSPAQGSGKIISWNQNSDKDAGVAHNSTHGVGSEAANTKAAPDEGISGVFGALLGAAAGVAAGAAITYSIMSSKDEDPSSKYTDVTPQRIRATKTQPADDAEITTGIMKRDPPSDTPMTSQRISFKDRQPSASRSILTGTSTRASKTHATQERHKNSAPDHRPDGNNQIVRYHENMEMAPRGQHLKPASLKSSKNEYSRRRLALPSPSDTAPKSTTTEVVGKKSSASKRTAPSSRPSRPSSSFAPGSTSPLSRSRGIDQEDNGAVISTRGRNEEKLEERHASKQTPKADSSSSRIAPPSRPSAPSSEDKMPRRTSTEISYVSARNVPLPSNRSDVSEFYNALSHISPANTRAATLPVGTATVEDRRSCISAKDHPLPPSQVGSYGFNDRAGHSSGSSYAKDAIGDVRSQLSARNVPLPASQAGTSDIYCENDYASTKQRTRDAGRTKNDTKDKRSHVSSNDMVTSRSEARSHAGDRLSRVSARNIPLPASENGFHSLDGAKSHISARNVPLPQSSVGGWCRDWEGAPSIAPSDSISCIGSK